MVRGDPVFDGGAGEESLDAAAQTLFSPVLAMTDRLLVQAFGHVDVVTGPLDRQFRSDWIGTAPVVAPPRALVRHRQRLFEEGAVEIAGKESLVQRGQRR